MKACVEPAFRNNSRLKTLTECRVSQISDWTASWQYAMAASGVRREKAALSSGRKAHPAIRSSRKQSEQSMEVTKWLKPSNSGHDLVTARVCRPQRE